MYIWLLNKILTHSDKIYWKLKIRVKQFKNISKCCFCHRPIPFGLKASHPLFSLHVRSARSPPFLLSRIRLEVLTKKVSTPSNGSVYNGNKTSEIWRNFQLDITRWRWHRPSICSLQSKSTPYDSFLNIVNLMK